MISRPRALVARALHMAGCAHLLRSVRAGVVRLSRHRPMAPQCGTPCRSSWTRSRGPADPRADSRHVWRADVDPEQSRTESPRVRSTLRGERPRRAGVRAVSVSGILLRLDTIERGNGDVRPHRSAAAVDRRQTREPMCIRWRSCAIRRRSRHCAGGSKQTSPTAGGIRCSTRRSEGSRTKSSPSSHTRVVRENASTACSAWPSTSSGPATTTSTTSFSRWRRSPEMPAPRPSP